MTFSTPTPPRWAAAAISTNVAYAYDLKDQQSRLPWGPAGGAACGAVAVRRSALLTGQCTPAPATANGIPENGVFGDGIVGLKQNSNTKALELSDYYGPTNAEWLVKRDLDMQVTPVIFNYKGHELMVDAGKECRLYLMDTKSIGGDDHRTPLYPQSAAVQ